MEEGEEGEADKVHRIIMLSCLMVSDGHQKFISNLKETMSIFNSTMINIIVILSPLMASGKCQDSV